jgi:hypothetical protein
VKHSAYATKMGKKRKELSHEEIWDDSGLVESWNQSYEEYKVRESSNLMFLALMRS